MFRFGVLLLLALHAPVSAAEESASLSAITDGVFKKWAGPDTPGCAVAIAQAGKPVLQRAYGRADLEHYVPNTPETVFEAASVSKQFTAAAVLLLAHDGKLALTDDVRKYLPELPDYGHGITIDQLLTHTSGLRDWGSIVDLEGWPRGTRAVTMEQALALTTRQRSLNFVPGARYSYTNTGYVLAAFVVQRVTGKTLAEFTRARIFLPLGMKHTQWRDNFRSVVPNRAIAYSRGESGYQQDMPFEDVYGHGGLLSTVGDLLLWTEALANNHFGSSITQQLQQIPVMPSGEVSDYGRGLHVRDFRGVAEMSHDGATGGYRTWLGRYPQQGVSIALLCNTDEANPGALARAIAHEILSTPTADAQPDKAIGERGATRGGSRAGTFYNELNGAQVALVFRDGALGLHNGVPLTVLDADTYRVKAGKFSFIGSDVFTAWSPGGEAVRYRRVDVTTASRSPLSAYAGEYKNDEVMATYRVVPVGSNLQFRVTDKPDYVFELLPLALDTFGGDNIVVRFERDKEGAVSGASVGTDRLFDLKFRRLAR